MTFSQGCAGEVGFFVALLLVSSTYMDHIILSWIQTLDTIVPQTFTKELVHFLLNRIHAQQTNCSWE